MAGQPQARKRPFGLYMVIALVLLNALTLVLLAILVYVEPTGAPSAILVYTEMTGATPAILQTAFSIRAIDVLVSALLVVLAAVLIVIAIGLWRLRRWAWVGTMIVIGFGLATDILSYFRGNPYYGAMVTHVLTIFYLNDRDVQVLFERRRTRETAG